LTRDSRHDLFASNTIFALYVEGRRAPAGDQYPPSSGNGMVSTQDVKAAYHLILGRPPESGDVLLGHAKQYESIGELREAFLNSPEFQSILLRRPQGAVPLDWGRQVVETEASTAEMAEMISRVEATWQHLGQSEPHWSVLVNDCYRAERIGQNEELFYQTGRTYLQRLQRAAERCGISLGNYRHCFELGCGVGRLTIWLSKQFESVVGADISAAHLEIARATLHRLACNNVNLMHIASLDDFDAMPHFDLFTSLIVLQHNPPPVIALLLERMLRKLRPGGIAYFQLPTFIADYRFIVGEYLGQPNATGRIEMHAFPQPALFDIIERCGCRLLEIREDDEVGREPIVSNTVFLAKS
jgi:SAM-dependent methyltransferase